MTASSLNHIVLSITSSLISDKKDLGNKVKTAQEITALTGWIAEASSLLAFDGSHDDEVLQGVIQAHQDLAFENRRPDVFARELIGRWSPSYAKGYDEGRRMANSTFASLQQRKGFPDNKGFSVLGSYGAAR